MAETRDNQRLRYPLPVYNFRVRVDDVALSFTEISGIGVTYEQVTYRHGLTFLEGEQIQTFALDKFVQVTCKRGTILGAKPMYLYDWLTQRDLRSMEVSLCDGEGVPVFAWQIANAVPTSLKAPTFSAASKDVSVDTLELQVRGVSVVQL